MRVGVSVERNREEKGVLVDGLAHDVRVEVCGDSIGGEGMCGVGGGGILMRVIEGILMGGCEDTLNTVVPPPFNPLVHAFCSWHAASRHGV